MAHRDTGAGCARPLESASGLAAAPGFSAFKGHVTMPLRVFALLLLFAGLAHAQPGVRDDAGDVLRLAAPARRIVSLAPNITELLFDAGAGDWVVGAVAYSDYPPAARRVPRVGNGVAPDLEAIAALRPDLVIAWKTGNRAVDIARLRALRVPVFVSEPRRLEDVADTLERFGQLAGTQAQANAAAAAYRARLAQLRQSYSGRPPVRVFVEIWHQPMYTVNGAHPISNVLALCGGENVFASLATLAPEVNQEAVLKADPEVIIASETSRRTRAWLDTWRAWPGLTAVVRGNLFSIPADLLHRDTPRLLDGAQQVCDALALARTRR